ncbi:hypothetical protein HDU98_008510 [Podochytrium sp. JEL0797]|nr:hypothetical protein HDU98_008510 [Podochytrium sp. JEL0797]
MNDSSHRTIWGGGASMGLSNALSGYPDESDPHSSDEASASASPSPKKSSQRKPRDPQSPITDPATFSPDGSPRRKSSVRFHRDTAANDDDSPSAHPAPPKSLTSSRASSIHILPEAPKPSALDEFPAVKASRSKPGHRLVGPASENGSKVTSIDDSYASSSEFHGTQHGSLFMSTQMSSDRYEIRAQIQKNREEVTDTSSFHVTDATGVEEYDAEQEVTGSSEIRDLVRTNRGSRLPDAMPIRKLLHAIAETHAWTPEEVEADLAVLEKYRIRNVHGARSVMAQTWEQMSELLPVTKDAIRKSIGGV